MKRESIQVRFCDGSERTLPLHGISHFQIMGVLDELDIRDFGELEFKPTASLATMRFTEKVAALALSFPSVGETWTVERTKTRVCHTLVFSPLPIPPPHCRPRACFLSCCFLHRCRPLAISTATAALLLEKGSSSSANRSISSKRSSRRPMLLLMYLCFLPQNSCRPG